MTNLSLDDIKKRVDELALKIAVPEKMLPTYGSMKWDSHPYIELDHRGYMHYVVSERGRKNERLALDLDDLLYLIFADITFWMAMDYELENRIEGLDSRRMLFEKQEELLGILNAGWRQRKLEDHQSTLLSAPFDDLAGLRAKYWGELRKQGYSEQNISDLVYEKYPKNK